MTIAAHRPRSLSGAACDTLMGVAGWLEDGFECRLPLLAIEGVVLQLCQ